MSTRKTSVEIDEQLLEAVRDALSTKTIRETIEAAFREVVRRKAIEEEIVALSAMQGMDLDDPEVMAKAWRS